MDSNYSQIHYGGLSAVAEQLSTVKLITNDSQRSLISSTEDTIESFIDMNPLTCKAPSLRGHIVNDHLKDYQGLLIDSGVPLRDIGIAAYREIPLDWVVKKIYQELEQNDQDINAKFEAQNIVNHEPNDYREMLIKTLMCIEQYDTATIDWKRVMKSYPNTLDVTFDPENDSYVDDPFDPSELLVSKK